MKKIIPVVLLVASLSGCNSDSSVNGDLNNSDELTPGKKCEYYMNEHYLDINPVYYPDRNTDLDENEYPIEYPKALEYTLKINKNEVKETDKIKWVYRGVNEYTDTEIPTTGKMTKFTFPKHNLYYISLYINDAYCTSKSYYVEMQRHKSHPVRYTIQGDNLEFCIADGNILDENTVVNLKHKGYVGRDENNRLEVNLTDNKYVRNKCTIIQNFRRYVKIEGSYTTLYYNLDSTIEEYGYDVLTSGLIRFKQEENVTPIK